MVKRLFLAVAVLVASVMTSAAQAVSTGTEIFGYLGYYPDDSNSYDRLGWYSIATDGAMTPCWFTPDDEISNGFVANGKLYGYTDMSMGGESYGVIFKLYNLETGAVEQTVQLDSKSGFLGFDSMCYVPGENAAYGYARTDYYTSGMGCEQAFCKISLDKPTNIAIVKKVGSSIDRCVSLALNPDDGMMYGITRFGNLVKVGTDGTQTMVGALRLLDGTEPSGLSAGLVYDTAKHVFIWNALEKGSSRDSYAASYLYTLNPATREMARVCTFKNNEIFTFFAVAESAATGTPDKAKIVSNTFAGTPSLTGSFTLTMPTSYTDGTAIVPSTQLELIAKVDGEDVSTTSHKAGATATVTVGPLTQGTHNFTFNVKAGGETGAAAATTLYIGNDTPNAPTSVRFNALGISWQASAGSVHGGYVDESALRYKVAVDGTTVAENVEGTHFDYKVPAGTLAVHTATVTAVCNGLESEGAVSNGFVSGTALSLPVSIVPTAEEAQLVTLYDANRDGNGWRFSEPYMGDPYFVFQCNGKAGDDWIFLPATDFNSADMIYSLSFDARRGDTNVAEKVDAYLATSPDPNYIVKEIMAETGPATYDFETLSAEFTVPSAGVYYVGIHACGDTNAYFLFVNHFKINALRSAGSAPAAVTDLTVTPKAQGALAVEVSFKMPTLTTTGETIAAGTNLKATVSTGAASAEVSGTPGAQCNVELAIVNGENTVTVQVADGTVIGEMTTVNVYGGLDNPKCVENLRATIGEDDYTAHLTWEAPVEGEHGGYVKPDGVKYWLITYTTTEYAEYPVKSLEIGTDVFEYTYTLTQGASLQTVRLGILAENEIGEAEYFGSLSLMLGKPYNLPMDEMFAGRDLRYSPITVGGDSDDYDAYWGIDDPTIFGASYANMSGKALMATPDRATSKGRVALPKFKVGSAPVELSFSFFANDKMPATQIYAISAGMIEPVAVGTLNPDGKSGWTLQTLQLPADFKALGWVGVFIDVQFSSLEQALLVERYKFEEGTGTGVNGVFGGENIVCETGRIVYTDLAAPVTVYNLSGGIVAKIEGSGTLSLPAGIYLLNGVSGTTKVCIR